MLQLATSAPSRTAVEGDSLSGLPAISGSLEDDVLQDPSESTCLASNKPRPLIFAPGGIPTPFGRRRLVSAPASKSLVPIAEGSSALHLAVAPAALKAVPYRCQLRAVPCPTFPDRLFRVWFPRARRCRTQVSFLYLGMDDISARLLRSFLLRSRCLGICNRRAVLVCARGCRPRCSISSLGLSLGIFSVRTGLAFLVSRQLPPAFCGVCGPSSANRDRRPCKSTSMVLSV